MITKGSMRFTDQAGEKIVFEANSDLYKQYCHIAQEIWDSVTRTWRMIPDKYPTHLNNASNDYLVYLDGQIVAWWNEADSLRGWVDVWAVTQMPYQAEVFKHRLFGRVKFEARVFSEV